MLIANATNEDKRRRLADIKAFLKGQHIKLEEYDESLVNRLVKQVRVYDEGLKILLTSEMVIKVDK